MSLHASLHYAEIVLKLFAYNIEQNEKYPGSCFFFLNWVR